MSARSEDQHSAGIAQPTSKSAIILRGIFSPLCEDSPALSAPVERPGRGLTRLEAPSLPPSYLLSPATPSRESDGPTVTRGALLARPQPTSGLRRSCRCLRQGPPKLVERQSFGAVILAHAPKKTWLGRGNRARFGQHRGSNGPRRIWARPSGLSRVRSALGHTCLPR